MVSGLVDYAKTYFIHSTLTKVHGELTFSSLKTLKQELKANASWVTSELGGGVHGHLGLVLNQIEYLLISALTYTQPLHLGILNMKVNTTYHEAKRLSMEHAE